MCAYTEHLYAKYVASLDTDSFTLDITANFNVQFDPQGGEIISGLPEYIVEYGGTIATLPEAERTGYTLQGWDRSELPSEYIQTEYITSSGTQYIDTGIPVSSKNDFEIEFSKGSGMDAINRFLFAENPIIGDAKRGIFISYANTLNIQNGKGSRTSELLNDTEFHTLKICENYYTFDGTKKINGDGSVNHDYHYILFSAYDAAEPSKISNRGWIGSVKAVRIWQDGTLVRDMLPGIRISDGACGMYDLVTETFFANLRGDDFTPGPAVSVIKPDESYTHNVTRDRELKAVWTPNTYLITLDANDKTGSTRAEGLISTSSNVVYDSKYTEEQLPQLTREGYKFLGWFDEAGNKYEADAVVQIIEDTPLHAEWEAIQYKISYHLNSDISKYQLLEYIQNDENSAIDTGVKLNQDSRVYADFEYTSLKHEYNFIYGARDSAGVEEFETLYTTHDKVNQIRDDYGNQEGGNGDRIFTGYVPKVNERLILDKNGKRLSINGNVVATHNNAIFETNYSCYLFNTHYDKQFNSDETAVGKMYEFKIWNNGGLACDLIPCRDNDTGEVGMYDLVRGQFHKNIMKGKLTGGPEVYEQQIVKYDEEASLFSTIRQQMPYTTLLGWSTDSNAERIDYGLGESVINLTNVDGGEIILYPVYTSEKYRYLEYIKSTGTQYIDTGVILNQDSKVKVEFAFTEFEERKYNFIFGARSEAGNDEFEICYTGVNAPESKKVLRDDYASEVRIFTDFSPGVNEKFTVEKNSNELYINGELAATHEKKIFNTINTCCLFETHYGSMTTDEYGIGRLYACQIRNGDELVRDFVPVYSNELKQAGLLDLVHNIFYGNAGSGNLIAGPEKQEEPEGTLTLMINNKTKESVTVKPKY